MALKDKFIVRLTSEQRQELEKLAATGTHSVATILRARILLDADGRLVPLHSEAAEEQAQAAEGRAQAAEAELAHLKERVAELERARKPPESPGD